MSKDLDQLRFIKLWQVILKEQEKWCGQKVQFPAVRSGWSARLDRLGRVSLTEAWGQNEPIFSSRSLLYRAIIILLFNYSTALLNFYHLHRSWIIFKAERRGGEKHVVMNKGCLSFSYIHPHLLLPRHFGALHSETAHPTWRSILAGRVRVILPETFHQKRSRSSSYCSTDRERCVTGTRACIHKKS